MNSDPGTLVAAVIATMFFGAFAFHSPDHDGQLPSVELRVVLCNVPCSSTPQSCTLYPDPCFASQAQMRRSLAGAPGILSGTQLFQPPRLVYSEEYRTPSTSPKI